MALVHHLASSEPERGAEERRRLRSEEAAYLRTVDAILSPSRESAEAARRLANRPLPVAVVPPGRDRLGGGPLPLRPGPAAIRERAHGPLQAAFVGNLIPRKRLIELLDGLAAAPGWTLAIAGREDADREYTRRVRRRVGRPELWGRVRSLGPVGPAALAGLLRESVLLAVPSTHEGFGIVYLEGAAFGLPALAAASGGAAGIVADGRTGWLIREKGRRGAAERITARLSALAADRSRLAAMGVAAAARHAAHPTWRESTRAADGLFARVRRSPAAKGPPAGARPG